MSQDTTLTIKIEGQGQTAFTGGGTSPVPQTAIPAPVGFQIHAQNVQFARQERQQQQSDTAASPGFGGTIAAAGRGGLGALQGAVRGGVAGGPAGAVSGFGRGLQAIGGVGGLLGGSAAIISRTAIAAGGTFAASGAITSRVADELAQFSPEIAGALAEEEVARITRLFDRAQAIGPDVAEAIRARTDVAEAAEPIAREFFRGAARAQATSGAALAGTIGGIDPVQAVETITTTLQSIGEATTESFSKILGALNQILEVVRRFGGGGGGGGPDMAAVDDIGRQVNEAIAALPELGTSLVTDTDIPAIDIDIPGLS